MKLYTNKEKLNAKVEEINNAISFFQSFRPFVEEKGIEFTPENVEKLSRWDVSGFVADFKKRESAKIKKMIAKVGESVLTEGWESKVEEKAKVLRESLRITGNDHSLLHTACMQLEFLEFSSDVEYKHDQSYFEDLYSVYLPDDKKDFYDKHVKTCDLLNELIGTPENEFQAICDLFFFNEETKQFEVRVKPYSLN